MKPLVAVLAMAAGVASGAPPLVLPDDLPGTPGPSVPPNVLFALSLTYHDVAAAYTGPYEPAREYDGYFNPRLCYSYPPSGGKRGVAGDPDLGAERGFFSANARAGERNMCSGAFSGNFLNWASMSRLDLVRLGLTGGDRFIDRPGDTVLQRAVLPDGPPNEDFYAHPELFRRKTVADGAGVTPFGEGVLHVVSCRDRILFSRTDKGSRCDAPRRGKSARLLISDKRLGEYAARVRVCDSVDAGERGWLCRGYGDDFKPEGALQEVAARARIGLMAYLTGRGVEDPNLYGGVLRAPLKRIDGEWSARTGVLKRDPDEAGTPFSGTINYINRLGRDGVYKAHAPLAELHYEGVRYLQGRFPAQGSGGHDAQFPVFDARTDPLVARCQRNAIAVISRAHGAEDRYIPGNSNTAHLDKARAADAFGPGDPFNVMAWTDLAGKEAGLPKLSASAIGPGETGSLYLAGIAMWAASGSQRQDADSGIETLAAQLSPMVASGPNPLSLAARRRFFDGSDPARLRSAVAGMARRAVMQSEPVASAATASSGANGDGYVLQASYDRAARSGDLVRLDLAGGRPSGAPAWSAAAQLPAPNARKIFTTVERNGETVTAPFTSTELASKVLDAELVAYLRGDRSKEGQGMRVRTSPLGDIVRSTPLIVGPPSAAGQGEGYAAFRARHATRRPLAYVGANDGMLHGFDAATGVERLAYVPRALHAALPELARPDYSHRAFVDASPGAGEALTAEGWRTVLAAGYGMGNKGVFAIDVTTPDSFASGAGELWQFSDRDDRQLGHVVAAPAIARFRTSLREGVAQYRHFAIVTSGFNNYDKDQSPDGALFLLALDKPRRERWRNGVNYFRFAAPAREAGQANALGPPAVVLGADGAVRHVYAGDLQGSVWRFDFTGNAPWRGASSLLFTARDAEGRRQPITSAPRVVYAPGGGHLILFGTGRMLVDEDAGVPGDAIQSMYAIHDALVRDAAAIGSRSALIRRRLEAGGNGFRVLGEEIDYAKNKGWYFDFAGQRSGERITSSPMVDGGVMVATSVIPAADECATPSTRTYALSALTGMANGAASTDADGAVTGVLTAGAAPGPPLLVLSGATTSGPDGAGRVTAMRRYSFYPSGPGGKAPVEVRIAVPGHRLSWREITNWQELHDAATEGESR
ncbi:MAG TPA: PilC/PilY family type IV pilus protein [Telluria sp.]|nr:PilC/PilY family type IV pilus protein [Telluria sp.]